MKRRVQRHDVIQPLDPSYKLIPLTQGQNALVDTADFEWLNQWNWIADWCEDTQSFYARRRGGFRMHRVILGCGPKEQGDHKNHRTLDNRRQNLRKATKAQNVQNRRQQLNCKNPYKGITWNKEWRKWSSEIRANGVRRFLGYFKTAKEAARAYNEAAVKYHGEFARLNVLSDC